MNTRTKKTKTGVTPMMAQYMSIRETAGDALLFYRMGDFYELFFDDAIQAAEALDIALTKRGKYEGKDIAMCGVPVISANGYLMRLIEKGFRVAVCEQMESPAEAKKRGGKSVVRREMVRLVTPGTLTEDTLLDAKAANRLAAINCTASGQWALAWVDVSTGEFASMDFGGDHGKEQLAEALVSLSPKEVLHCTSVDLPRVIIERGYALTAKDISNFRVSSEKQKRLAAAFGATSLDGFGAFSRAQIGALIAVFEYVEITQAGSAPKLNPPTCLFREQYLAIDPATRSSLEITRTLKGTRAGSLLAAVDRTTSAPGARLLADRLERPSTDLNKINQRLDSCEWLCARPDLAHVFMEKIKGLPDLSRSLSRLSLGRGGPRDLVGIARSVQAGADIVLAVARATTIDVPSSLTRDLDAVSLLKRPKLAALVNDMQAAFIDNPPMLDRDGGFVEQGWSVALDEQRSLRDNSRQKIAELQGKYIKNTGVSSLKIKHNNVLGYFVEVTPRYGQTLLESPFTELFHHRQTLGSAVRFSTDELSALAAEILSAADRALAMEREIYAEFLSRILAEKNTLQEIANALARLDVLQSSAHWANAENGVRPEPTMDTHFDVQSARHPVVEQALLKTGAQGFTPNDCKLCGAHEAAAKLLFVTGPNMAGKSTWLRQNAILVILMQAGLFVPAAKARIGIVDRLFSRVGASDDLSEGRSTFMVEMTETAAILNQATERSFVILDEIGRGTATWDGLALAWATAEHLQGVNCCRALFATHYHELTVLANRLPGIANVSLQAREWEGDLVFLHKVAPGAATRSYGIQVAKLSGMPEQAVQRAREVLQELEEVNNSSGLMDDLPLFAAISEPEYSKKPSEVEQRLHGAKVDEMSPREALEFIYQLQELQKRGRS